MVLKINVSSSIQLEFFSSIFSEIKEGKKQIEFSYFGKKTRRKIRVDIKYRTDDIAKREIILLKEKKQSSED